MLHNQKILIIDQDPLIRGSLTECLKRKRYEPIEADSIEQALSTLKAGNQPDVILLDHHITGSSEFITASTETAPNIPIILITKYDKMDKVLDALKLGACDHIKKPLNYEELLLRVNRVMNEAKLKKEITRLKSDIKTTKNTTIPIVGESPEIKDILQMVEKIARSNARTILIQGESGTGKELIAQTVHILSKRADKQFVTVNCASIPETLLETELMGYEKGAYTDAKKNKKGLLELADGGTLFLDEIGEMCTAMQAKFLRILEDNTFRRIGGTNDIKVDIRIVAATNVKLKQHVKSKKFREDLYYRLLVVPIYLPPLRDRKKDILLIAEYFVNKYNRRFNKNVKAITPGAKKILSNYSWPGNVRELKNVIERTMILEDHEQILMEHLPYELSLDKKDLDFKHTFELPESGISLDEVEKSLVKQALTAARGKQVQAAKLLGLNRDAFRRRLKKYELISKD